MSILVNKLNSIQQRTERLIQLCDTLQEENNILLEQNQLLEQAVRTDKQKIIELEEKLKALKLARSLEGINSSKNETDEKALDIKQKINDFVREIEKCIVLLKK